MNTSSLQQVTTSIPKHHDVDRLTGVQVSRSTITEVVNTPSQNTSKTYYQQVRAAITFLYEKICRLLGIKKEKVETKVQVQALLKECFALTQQKLLLTWFEERLTYLENESITHQNVIGTLRLETLQAIYEQLAPILEVKEQPSYVQHKSSASYRQCFFGKKIYSPLLNIRSCNFQLQAVTDIGLKTNVNNLVQVDRDNLKIGAKLNGFIGHSSCINAQTYCSQDYYTHQPLMYINGSVGYHYGVGAKVFASLNLGSTCGFAFKQGMSFGLGWEYGLSTKINFLSFKGHVYQGLRQFWWGFNDVTRQKFHHQGLLLGNGHRFRRLQAQVKETLAANNGQMKNITKKIAQYEIETQDAFYQTKYTAGENVYQRLKNLEQKLKENFNDGDHIDIDRYLKQQAYRAYHQQTSNSFAAGRMGKIGQDKDLAQQLYLPPMLEDLSKNIATILKSVDEN